MFETVCIIHRIFGSISDPQMQDKTCYTKWKFGKGVLKNLKKIRRIISHFGNRYRIYILFIFLSNISVHHAVNSKNHFNWEREKGRERVRKWRRPFNTSVVKRSFNTRVVKRYFNMMVVKTHFNTRVVKTHFNMIVVKTHFNTIVVKTHFNTRVVKTHFNTRDVKRPFNTYLPSVKRSFNNRLLLHKCVKTYFTGTLFILTVLKKW